MENFIKSDIARTCWHSYLCWETSPVKQRERMDGALNLTSPIPRAVDTRWGWCRQWGRRKRRGQFSNH